jgi:ParB family chromosome partitioning protein
MPREVTALWAFVAELDQDSRLALLAHCIALTVNAVKLPWDKRPRALATADRLAEAVALDMAGYWRPTVRSYFGRVTKARILVTVREGVAAEAVERVADGKKVEMAKAAEQLLAGTKWLPAPLRTPPPDLERKVAGGDQGSDVYRQVAE